jgi:hypothetical protein
MEWSEYFERDSVGLGKAMLALFISSMLMLVARLLVIALHAVPHAWFGELVYFVLLVAGEALMLRWCLTWFGWTISLKAATLARVLAGVAGGIALVVLPLRNPIVALLVVWVVEYFVAAWIVAAAAERVDGNLWDDYTPPRPRERAVFGRSDPRLYTEEQFRQDSASARLRKEGAG